MLLGEKYYNNEEVIRVMTDTRNAVYKKKVKVYSETFDKYKWMTKIDLLYNYKLLIPVAYMGVSIVRATSTTYGLDDLLIEVKLNRNSAFTDEVQIDDEFDNGYNTYGTIFTRLNLLIESTESLLRENPLILRDNKSVDTKLQELIDRCTDEEEDEFTFENKVFGDNNEIKIKDSVKMAIYVNDYNDSIIKMLQPKITKYDKMVQASFDKIKDMCSVDFGITTFRQLMDTVYAIIPSLDVRIGIDEYPINEAKPVLKNTDLDTLYTFDSETMMYIVKHIALRTIHDYMILKYWYDIDITSFTYKYFLIRNSKNGDLFILLCKPGRVVYSYK